MVSLLVSLTTTPKLSARFLKSHASQKPPCGELSQPGFEHAGSWYRAFLTQVGPWPCGESNFFVDKLVSSFTTLML